MKIVFTMPVYNEEEGIVEFCEEILQAFTDYDIEIVLVNDRSTDNSKEVISNNLLSKQHSRIKLFNNDLNLGHGPSTLIGIRHALMSPNAELIVTVDGDGQFRSSEILNLVISHQKLKFEITEGVRINRQDPYFRKISTKVCRFLVYTATGQLPRDANTCLRIYDTKTLSGIVESIPMNSLIPNVMISAITRNKKLRLLESNITSIPRRASNPNGSTWRQTFDLIPSKRYLTFCLRATYQWIINLGKLRNLGA